MNTESSLEKLKDSLNPSSRMPLVFLGHGSPMNIIEDNVYRDSWSELGRSLPEPQAILVISAHWMTRGSTLVDISTAPRTIHDFYGFPDELYKKNYPAVGHPEFAAKVTSLLSDLNVQKDDSWGLDHGAWSVLEAMYPAANVPVFQLSIDVTKDMTWHLIIGQMLSELRELGVLILGSGNLVHNLGALRFDNRPHDWAIEFDHYAAKQLEDRNFAALTDLTSMGSLIKVANPTLEHYAPALTIAGASDHRDTLLYTSQGIELGSLSMRSFVFHST